MKANEPYLFVASKHDLIGDLLDVVLDSLGLVLVFEAERLVFDDLALLFLEGLGGGALWLFLLGGHFTRFRSLNSTQLITNY